jgi:hypothetical protein
MRVLVEEITAVSKVPQRLYHSNKRENDGAPKRERMRNLNRAPAFFFYRTFVSTRTLFIECLSFT